MTRYFTSVFLVRTFSVFSGPNSEERPLETINTLTYGSDAGQNQNGSAAVLLLTLMFLLLGIRNIEGRGAFPVLKCPALLSPLQAGGGGAHGGGGAAVTAAKVSQRNLRPLQRKVATDPFIYSPLKPPLTPSVTLIGGPSA